MLAAVHVDGEAIPQVQRALAAARRQLRLADDYCFKHLGASEKTHEAFFSQICQVPMRAHALIVDRRCWGKQYAKGRKGKDQLCDCATDLIAQWPDDFVAGQTLWIDLPRRELSVVDRFRRAIRKSLKADGRTGFESIDPRPDDKDVSGVMQVADMLAGEIREHGGLTSAHLAKIKNKIVLV